MCDENCYNEDVEDINKLHQEKGRELAVKELIDHYCDCDYKKETDIQDFFYRLGDYCVDSDNGYALPAWLTKEEALYIIYSMLDPIKNYYMNKNRQSLINLKQEMNDEKSCTRQ